MYRKVLLPLDGSNEAECAIPHLQAIASGCNVSDVILLRVITSLPAPYYDYNPDYVVRLDSQNRLAAQSYLEQTTKQFAEIGLSVRADIVEGEAADAIIQYTTENGVDLIVMATHGRSGMKRWALGSVADRVVRYSDAPVLLVRAHKDTSAT